MIRKKNSVGSARYDGQLYYDQEKRLTEKILQIFKSFSGNGQS